MTKTPCEEGCHCVPSEYGFYWATSRKYGWRAIVQIGMNGFRQTRVWVPRMSSTFDPTAFKDFSPRLIDPAPLPPPEESLASKI